MVLTMLPNILRTSINLSRTFYSYYLFRLLISVWLVRPTRGCCVYVIIWASEGYNLSSSMVAVPAMVIEETPAAILISLYVQPLRVRGVVALKLFTVAVPLLVQKLIT